MKAHYGDQLGQENVFSLKHTYYYFENDFFFISSTILRNI
jgi:hypothetical protein